MSAKTTYMLPALIETLHLRTFILCSQPAQATRAGDMIADADHDLGRAIAGRLLSLERPSRFWRKTCYAKPRLLRTPSAVWSRAPLAAMPTSALSLVASVEVTCCDAMQHGASAELRLGDPDFWRALLRLPTRILSILTRHPYRIIGYCHQVHRSSPVDEWETQAKLPKGVMAERAHRYP